MGRRKRVRPAPSLSTNIDSIADLECAIAPLEVPFDGFRHSADVLYREPAGVYDTSGVRAVHDPRVRRGANWSERGSHRCDD